MVNLNRFEKWVLTVGTVILMWGLFWIACSQKTPIDPTSSIQKEIPILANITASPSQIAVGGAQSEIRVQLVDQEGRPLSNEQVTFSTTLGNITSEDITDQNGWATAVLTSGENSGNATVTARYGKLASASITVKFISSYQAQIQINSYRKEILANGIDTTAVTITLLGDSAKPVAGAVVHFSTTLGDIPSSVVTGTDGKGKVYLTSSADSRDTTTTVTATYDTLSVAIVVIFKGIQFSVEANPTSILADGEGRSTIKAILKETSSHIALSDAEIHFGTTLGTIPAVEHTDASGVAKVSLISGTTPDTAVVVARYGDVLLDTTEVVFQESIPTYIEVSATPSVIPADGQSQSTIRAALTDANRNPVPDGTLVVFDIIEGSGTIGRQRTTVGGVAATTLTSGTQPDTAKIVGSVGSLADTVMVVYVVGAVDRIEVTADPDSIPADGITTSRIRARVLDTKNNPIEGVTVEFSASVGDIVQSVRTNSEGLAEAEYSSKVVGLATITAEVGGVFGTTSIQVIPGGPYSITITYEPHFIYVRDCGKNQTATIYAEVLDEKNNPVANGTLVKFSLYASPGVDSVEGGRLSSKSPIPTVGGVAQVSYISGIRAGASRIQAEVTADSYGNPVSPPVMGISTEIVIFAGPPYIENVNDPSSSHLSLGVEWGKQNIWHWIETSEITVLVGDKYNNPVQEGTAVYLTTSGGVITTKAYTDANGIAKAVLESGNPEPTIDRFYNYIGMQDPNTGEPIGDHDTDPRIPDFELGQIENSKGDSTENDGIARIIAYTEGVDSLGNSVRVWDENYCVFSKHIYHFAVSADKTTLSPGESAVITIECWDENGNPVVSGSTLEASATPSDVAELSWTSETTDDPGNCHYYLTVTNTINPTDTTAVASLVRVRAKIDSKNGKASDVVSIFCDTK